ncbi:efflux RND transporter periplasmic adaptor subunit, partial [Ramlibacter aquaticus]
LILPNGSAQLALLRTEALTSAPIPLADALPARLAYDEDVTVRVFPPVAGRIAALRVQPGDRVRAGQVLADIDAPDLGTARADLDKARADEERKRLAWERARELGPGEGIARRDAESAQADWEAARAETERARQRLGNLVPAGARAGARLTLTSPVAGVVAERNATPALELTPGGSQPLFVVTQLQRLWLLIDLPENLLASVKPGSAVSVESDAWPGERFRATLMQVGPVLDPNTRRVVARARLDNPGGKLLPEMFVRASVLQPVGTGLEVPNAALVTRGLYTYLFVETTPGRFQRRRVELATHGADSSFVRTGVAPGERVVVAGALLLDAELGSGTGPR